MFDIFEYARNRIEAKYNSDSNSTVDAENIREHKQWELDGINQYEEKSKKSIKTAISYRIKAFWRVQSDEEQGNIILLAVFFAFIIVRFVLNINKLPFNLLILDASINFSIGFSFLCIIFVYRLIRKRIIKKKRFYIVLLLLFILSTPYYPKRLGYKTTQIGDFYEANEYTEKYYVIMSREPKAVENRKQYTLPAEIERRSDYEDTTEIREDFIGREYGGHDVYTLQYHIIHLYFPNGGYLSFDYDYSYDDTSLTRIYPGKESMVTDYKGDDYYITLTTKKYKTRDNNEKH